MADFLIKAGADIELGCSTPLMEAAQEGHLELVKYLLAAGEQGKESTELQIKVEIILPLCLSSSNFCFLIQEQMFMPPRQRETQH